MIVYKATNKLNGKSYVGVTVNSLKRRIWEHCSLKYSGTAIFSKAIKKYGKESFIFEKIDSAISHTELLEKEAFWIKECNAVHPNGYNFLKNSIGSEISRSRWVEVRCVEDGRIYPNASSAAKSYNVTAQGVWSVCSGRTDFAGEIWSFEYTDPKKRNVAQTKKKNRKELAAKGYREGYEKTKKQIKCVETGEIFDSGKSAGKILNINPSQISKVCQGKNMTAGGYTFIYL